MCFYVEKAGRPLIAHEDIVVWKAISIGDFCMDKDHDYHGSEIFDSKKRGAIGFFSFYRGFKYLFGETYKKSKKVFGKYVSISDKLRSEGFHSYDRRIKCYRNGDYAIKCFIPKGALYHHNSEDNEYISSAIRITKDMRNVKTEKS